MALPITPNMTCDIYRFGHAAPSPPDVANVPCFLTANYFRHTESGEGDIMASRYTHTMLMPLGTDCRDGYAFGVYGNSPDTVAIPEGAGTAATIFNVIFVETKGKGTPQEHLKVYLDRLTPTWPTNYV